MDERVLRREHMKWDWEQSRRSDSARCHSDLGAQLGATTSSIAGVILVVLVILLLMGRL
jgi:hypothetical protein